MSLSRRNFVRNMTLSSASVAALAAFPLSIRKALAIPADIRSGTIKDVKHVVILMQENRSFDHYFGTLEGVRGFGDRFTIPLPDGRTVWEQKKKDGSILTPYHLDSSKGNAQRAGGTPHTWVDGQQAWDHGRMQAWPATKNDLSMGYFRESELPFQFALANAFTICDGYHCSMHTGTNSNRLFHWTGTNGPRGEKSVAVVNNAWDSLGTALMGYEWTTYAERLQEAGVTWRVYQNLPDNFTDNPLAGFKQYRKQHSDSKKGNAAFDPVAEPEVDQQYPLLKGVANTMPDDGFLEQLRKDVLDGNLPEVTWIVAPANYSEHPSPSSPTQGAWYTQEVLDALTADPEVWNKTVFLVNFDENDGFFDHCPTPAPPSYDDNGNLLGKTTLPEEELKYEYYTQPSPSLLTGQPKNDNKPFGPGIRVPMYVISPWSRGGWVNSQIFDHTSVLQFLEQRFGVIEPNISPYRRAVCGDLTSTLNFKTPNSESLPYLSGRQTKSEADSLRRQQESLGRVPLPVYNSLPTQLTGVRLSRALPYELHVSARCERNSGVQLIFANTGKAAAVFHVYDKLNLDRIPRRYMVEAGKTLDDVWDVMADNLGRYDLWVLGPNGFHRHFKGNISLLREDKPLPEIRVCYDIANGDVYLEMMNGGKQACTFHIQSEFYREDGPWDVTVKAGATQKVAWDLSKSGAWYDFSVSISDALDVVQGTGSNRASHEKNAFFYRRFAGRVETGKDGFSDPALGMAEF